MFIDSAVWVLVRTEETNNNNKSNAIFDGTVEPFVKDHGNIRKMKPEVVFSLNSLRL